MEAIKNFDVEKAILQIERQLCIDSFYEFVKIMWSSTIDNELVLNWHMEYLCDELQTIGERVIANKPSEGPLIINISPGTSKSSICSVFYSCWLWVKKQSLRFFNVCYAQPLANDLSLKSRAVLESDKFKELFPEFKLKKDNNQKGCFHNEGGGYRFATSIGSSLTGFHSNIIVVDDPLSAQGAQRPVELEKANNFLSQTLSTRYVDKKCGQLVVVMQRLAEDDCTAHILENDKRARLICIPAELTDDVRPAKLREKYIDGLMDVNRMPKSYLEDFECVHGSHVYAGQHLQSPYSPDGSMFQPDCMEEVDYIDPDEIVSEWRAIDKAGTDANRTKNPNACYTAGVKMAKLKDGRFAILDVMRGRWGATEREKKIKKTAIKDGRKTRIVIEQEPGSGGKESAENTIRNLAGFSVVKERPNGNKIFRADPFSVQVNNGNVLMVKGDWNKDYTNEMRHFPNSKFKDQIDASAMAFSRLNRASNPRVRTLGK